MATVKLIDTKNHIELTMSSLLLPSHGGLPPYYWCRVWYEDNRGERPEDQAANLGHSGTRALQGRHPLLLPWSRRGAHGLRHHQVRYCGSHFAVKTLRSSFHIITI